MKIYYISGYHTREDHNYWYLQEKYIIGRCWHQWFKNNYVVDAVYE